ncbi:MAG: ribbon-helix-helix domain-containing protein [Candidatus ainarchaeum sp.]|nr:ribbon-helix-helix domain-containing protein [Candidatus ainarchaeum sp.]
MLTVEIHENYAKAIDELIKKSGMYSSRSEFLKDAIRKNYEELIKFDKGLSEIHELGKKIGADARAKGYNGGLLTKEERTKIALEYAKERGIKL